MPGRTWTAAALREKAAGRWVEIALLPLFAVALRFPPSYSAGIRWWHILWLTALAAVFGAALLKWKGRRERRRKRRGLADGEAAAVMLATALLLLNAGVRLDGGIDSVLWSGYFIFMVVATCFFSRWWQQCLFLFAVVGLELIQSAADPGSVASLGYRAALLIAFQAVFHFLFLRERGRLQQTVAEYERLKEDAKHYGRREEDRMGLELEAHSTEAKIKRLIKAEEELDTHMARLLSLARRALEAQTVLFLKREGNHFVYSEAAEGGSEVDRKVKIRVGEGAIGGSAKLRKPILIKNPSKGRHRVSYLRGEGKVASLMMAPVIEEEVVRGILIADHTEEGRFGRGELEVFEGFAVEVNLLLENSRSSWRDRRDVSKVEAVSALSKALMSSTLNFKEMLEILVEKVEVIVPYDQCAVFLVDPKSRRLVLHVSEGFNFPKGKDFSFPMNDNSLASYIATHGQPLLFSDVKHRQIVPGYTGIEKMHSFMGFPFSFREELEGVLIFASAQQGKFTSYQKETLDILVNQASAQVSNAILHEQVKEVAITDGLTGLYNHRHFQERLSHELRRSERQGQPVSLLLLDIDHFKSLNDDYGHPFGDEVLKGISRELTGVARDIDLVARYGGEEFVVILGSTGRRACRKVAERIRKGIEALSFDFKGEAVKTTVSLGGATFPEDGETKEELVRHADEALYHSKRSGRNRYTAFKNVS